MIHLAQQNTLSTPRWQNLPSADVLARCSLTCNPDCRQFMQLAVTRQQYTVFVDMPINEGSGRISIQQSLALAACTRSLFIGAIEVIHQGGDHATYPGTLNLWCENFIAVASGRTWAC
ncbi:hypothetical protein OK016_09600 [Vibrio chagasii]|nr:hypothetical protein [Vibrio chagasii]